MKNCWAPQPQLLSDNSALSQAQSLGLMEKSIFCFTAALHRAGGWRKYKGWMETRFWLFYTEKTLPWKQLGRKVLTQACKRPQIEMNKMQLCPVANSLLGLFHFMSLAIFA